MKRTVLLALSMFVGACGDASVLIQPISDRAPSAVATFTQLADSVSRAGTDTALAQAYASLAESIRQGGRVSPVTIAIDGAPTEFLATAQLTEYTDDRCASPAPCIVKIRNVLAFRANDPRQVIQLTSSSDGDPIRAYLFPVLVPFNGPSASLLYIDGKGGRFFGSSGSQKVAITTSEELCSPTGLQIVIAIYPAPPRCTKADFTISFDARAEPSSFLATNNTATASHTFAMVSQPVLGARLQVSAPLRVGPPIVITPSGSLPATLLATVDSVVHLEFTIRNTAPAPTTINFTSGQQFDFSIIDSSTGQTLWVWSADRIFLQALTSQTIAANGSLTFNAAWKPTKRGALVATGTLVSASHKAEARTPIFLP